MLVFENKGEIDVCAVMIIGVNVKDGDSPVGFFGTGLKYSIASILRWGETIRIHSGLNDFQFSVEETEIRGKIFGIPTIHTKYDRTTLGFTTDLGKQWEPWMVYREVWCNAHDEPLASVYETDEMPVPAPDITRVIISGEKMLAAHKYRSEFILDEHTPIAQTADADIFDGESNHVFYRGIAVRKLTKPSLYTYNILPQIKLTEDRTASDWETGYHIARALSSLTDEKIIRQTIKAPADSMEYDLDYGHATGSHEWRSIAMKISESKPLETPTSIRSKFIELDKATHCPSCGKEY